MAGSRFRGGALQSEQPLESDKEKTFTLREHCPCGIPKSPRPGRSGLHCPVHGVLSQAAPVVVGPVTPHVPLDGMKGWGGAPAVSAWVLANAQLDGEAN